MLDVGGKVISWNSGAQRIKGYAANKIIGRHFQIFYPPEEQATGHPERNLEAALRDGRFAEEGWRVRKDGSRFWASAMTSPVYDYAGAPSGSPRSPGTRPSRACTRRNVGNPSLSRPTSWPSPPTNFAPRRPSSTALPALSCVVGPDVGRRPRRTPGRHPDQLGSSARSRFRSRHRLAVARGDASASGSRTCHSPKIPLGATARRAGRRGRRTDRARRPARGNRPR